MNFKRIFITGFILLLPAMITIFLISLAVGFFYSYAAYPIGSVILKILCLIPGLLILKSFSDLLIPIIGFTVVFTIIIFIGYLTTVMGQAIFGAIEKYILLHIPVVSLIYPYAKQLIDTFLNKDKKTEFKSVVAVQYPRLGIYSIGFITSEGVKNVNKATGKELVSVFMPSSPTPFTGYTILIDKNETFPLQLTVDEAIRFVVSGGILTPKDLAENAQSKVTINESEKK